MYNKIKLVLG